MNPHKPESPVFYITKVLEQRTYFDEHGKKQTGHQWVPKLQADIDIGQLLQSGRTHALPAPTTPVAWLASPKGIPNAELLPAASGAEPAHEAVVQLAEEGSPGQVDPSDKLEQLIEAMGLDQDQAIRYFDIKIAEGWENDPASIVKAVQMLDVFSRVGSACATRLISITVKVADMGIDLKQFNKYAFAKYGKGYTSKADVLASIEQEVDELGTQPREQALAIIADVLAPA